LKQHKPWFIEGCSEILDQSNEPNFCGYRIQVKYKGII
jgi:hypothetical protein